MRHCRGAIGPNAECVGAIWGWDGAGCWTPLHSSPEGKRKAAWAAPVCWLGCPDACLPVDSQRNWLTDSLTRQSVSVGQSVDVSSLPICSVRPVRSSIGPSVRSSVVCLHPSVRRTRTSPLYVLPATQGVGHQKESPLQAKPSHVASDEGSSENTKRTIVRTFLGVRLNPGLVWTACCEVVLLSPKKVSRMCYPPLRFHFLFEQRFCEHNCLVVDWEVTWGPKDVLSVRADCHTTTQSVPTAQC